MTRQELVSAIEANDASKLEKCLKNADAAELLNKPSDKGEYLLNIAARRGNTRAIEILLQAGADANQASTETGVYNGYTSVHYAAFSGNADALRALIVAKADLDRPASDGWRPLHVAAFKGKHGVLAALLDAGVEVDAKTQQGQTPLVFAVSHGRVSDVRLLLKNGADVFFSDANKDSLLHHALHYQLSKLFENSYSLPEGQLDVAITLTLHGAPVQARNADDKEATYYVKKNFPSLQSVLELLARHAPALRRAPREWNFLALVAAPVTDLERLGLSESEAALLRDMIKKLNEERLARQATADGAVSRQGDSKAASSATNGSNNDNNSKDLTSFVPAGHPAITAEMLRSGVDPSGGRCPFFQKRSAPAGVPEAEKPLCPFSAAFIYRHRHAVMFAAAAFVCGVLVDQLFFSLHGSG